MTGRRNEDEVREHLRKVGESRRQVDDAKLRADEQVRAVERSMAAHALEAWSTASAHRGLADHDALLVHADALTRWSERLRLALRGDLFSDEEWLRDDPCFCRAVPSVGGGGCGKDGCPRGPELSESAGGGR